ncbi:MAG: carboxypeptidase regulatory-like domain-containing protein [Bryobacteraceae bacterium]
MTGSAWAQQVTATITGRVTDPTGAAIVGAKVTAVSIERGIPYTAITNTDGYYNLPNLIAGSYNVKVEAPGFETATQSGITLQMNQVAKLDFPLLVGNVQTTVEVTSAAPVLQTEQTLVGQVIDSRTDTTLPLPTRNYVELTLLAPGTVHPDLSTFENGFTTGNGGRPYVNGNREQADNFVLDGMDNNQVSDNLVGYAPSVDAIEEFQEITQNGPAEFGNFMGAIINTSIKSGTNQYHGDAFEFFRNNVLNSNLWQYNFEGAPRAAQRWNEFGGTLGGPIRHDKLFFFVDYQGERFDTPTTLQAQSLLTPAERSGDFSALLPNTIIYNPYDVTGGQRVPFPGNKIPTNLLSSVATKIVTDTSAYPLPTGSGLVNNFLEGTNSNIQSDQGDARVDWNLSDKDRIFGRYSQSQTTNPTTNSIPIQYNSFNNYPTHNGVLDWVHTASPSIVNDARVGVNYVFINDGAAGNGLSNYNTTVGLPGIPSSILPSMDIQNGFASDIIGNADVYELFADAVIQYEDTLLITHGSHTFHLGFQGWRERIDTFYSGNNGEAGTFDFAGSYTTVAPGDTFGTKNAQGIATGQPEADFMLGLPSQIGGGVNGGTWGQRSNIFASFFQDDWHITPNFTANIGLRWELHTPWCEVHDRQDNFGLFSGQIEYAGQDGNSCALYNQYNGITNYQPRVGLAWNVMRNTVVRAAYTLSNYLEGTGTNLRLPINPPFAHETSANYTTSQYLADSLPPTTLDQGLTPIASSSGFADATLRVWDPNVRPAVANQWNFTVQQQFSGSTTLQVGYVGQRTTHLMVPMPYFQEQLISPGVVAPSPYLAGNPTLTSEISQISGTASNGDQSYNALQVVFQKRLSHGLEYSVAYTYSKCMTNSSGYYGSWGGSAVPTSPYFQNLYDMKSEWGPCYYDVKHTLSSYATYDLPFGRDRQFGKNLNPVVNAILGDWQVNAIVLLHTGFPLTVSASDDTGTNSRGSRANCLAPVQYFNEQNSPLGGYQWFNQADFGPETGGTFGTCGVATVRGPGLATMDASLAKFFNFNERFKLEFRAEATDFTNTPILNAPNTGLGSTLGLLQSAGGAYAVFGRQIQFAMKFHY